MWFFLSKIKNCSLTFIPSTFDVKNFHSIVWTKKKKYIMILKMNKNYSLTDSTCLRLPYLPRPLCITNRAQRRISVFQCTLVLWPSAWTPSRADSSYANAWRLLHRTQVCILLCLNVKKILPVFRSVSFFENFSLCP